MPPDRHIVYVAYLRAYARGTGWLGMGLHFGIAASASATCPRCDGASADHKAALFHRDGVGVCITGLEARIDGIAVGIGLSANAHGHIQWLAGKVLRQQDEGVSACGCGIRVFATADVPAIQRFSGEGCCSICHVECPFVYQSAEVERAVENIIESKSVSYRGLEHHVKLRHLVVERVVCPPLAVLSAKVTV